MILKKVKAGALQFTMFIVVVIALLLAAFIILIHTHKRFKLQHDFIKETISNAEKGINYTLNHQIQQNDTLIINLQEEDYKTLKVNRDYWGVFEKVIAVSKIKNKTFKRVALIGAKQTQNERVALYVEEQNKPLVVVGNTRIQGLVYLPKQGVRTGNISGHSYYGSKLIYGNTKTSTSLPKLHIETQKQIRDISEKIKYLNQGQFLDLNTLPQNIKSRLSSQNSFYNPLQVIYSQAPINLSEVTLTGHILIQSKTKINVDASAKLKDVILIAPEIDIKNHVTGNFQAIATKNINVGINCLLSYPTALVLHGTSNHSENNSIQQYNPNQNHEEHNIKIESGTTVSGMIVYDGKDKPNNYNPQIIIKEKAKVIGEVYCNKNVELLGTVSGTMFTSNFVASQSGSVYQNHIYNGTIIVNNLPEEYIGLSFENTKNKGVLKWLY